MEEVFIEHLDQIYWQGYGEVLKEDNPFSYHQQLTAFTDTYKTQRNEISNSLFDDSGNGTIRSPRHSKHSKRGRNTGSLFAD